MIDTLQPYPDGLLQAMFEALREAGLELTLDQYSLLRRAVLLGYGGGWDDLKRLCRLLWVKPSSHYDGDVFDRAFDAFVEQHQLVPVRDDLSPQSELIEPPLVSEPPSESALDPTMSERSLPQVPPRKTTSQQSDDAGKVPTAFKSSDSVPHIPSQYAFKLRPTSLPLQATTVPAQWQALRQPLPVSRDDELDLSATVDQILQEGIFSDVVLRPVLARRAELLLLVDDASPMMPFRPALQPLIDAITEDRITPAQIYRFTRFPDDYLYDWQRSTRAIPMTTVLERAHQNRTIALIWSDSGAATDSIDAIYETNMYRFLRQLALNVRVLFWLNPLPASRWMDTSAQQLARMLDGRMMPLGQDMWRELTRQMLNPQGVYLQPYLCTESAAFEEVL
ncbi:MAG: hypothetical protein F6J95_030845 [Leptolyngbya sp. SIO1E4]|nr:hypothetical protein [Leptolyngbya sp. SIO1E4]